MKIFHSQLCFLFEACVIVIILISYISNSHCSPNRSRRQPHLQSLSYRYICQESIEDKVWLRSQLKKVCNCPRTIAPVCGSDDITYDNRCYIHCAAKVKFDGFQRGGRALTIVKMEPCSSDYWLEQKLEKASI